MFDPADRGGHEAPASWSPPRFGAGFRTRHFAEIIDGPRRVDWFEVIADTFIGVGGPRRARLERLRADYPVALHGLSLDIAGGDPLDPRYLDGLATLVAWLSPAYVSDHLAWTSHRGRASHDLLPVAYTSAVLDHVAARVDAVQARLGCRLLLENASAYVRFAGDAMDEADFLAALCRRTGCGVLLDVNNLVVNAANLGSDPRRYLDVLPAAAVGYVHVAGHATLPDVRIDTHGESIPEVVWTLFGEATRRFPRADVVVERDDAIPPFAGIVAEVDEARRRHRREGAHPPIAARPLAEVTESRPWPELQRAFFDALVGARAVDFDGLDARSPVSTARGMRVYGDAYAASHRAALAMHFPTLVAVLDPADFDRMVTAYLQTHPPTDYAFRSLGVHLAAFVREFSFTASYGVSGDVLASVAALEQAQVALIDAPDAVTVAPAEIAGLPEEAWSTLRVTLASSWRIVRSAHDVLPAVEAVARGEQPPMPRATPTIYLVRRVGDGTRSERISPDEAIVWQALADGDPFAVACARASADERTAAVLGATVVAMAVRWGLVATIEAPTVRVGSATESCGPLHRVASPSARATWSGRGGRAKTRARSSVVSPGR